MKKILVPLDFSDCSLAALDIAKSTALLYEEQPCLVLYHGLQKIEYPFDDQSIDAAEQRWKLLLENKLHKLEKNLRSEGYKVKCSLSVGNFIENIKEHCIGNTYELVVMGSHGANGLQEFLMGSKTQKVIRQIHECVLIVKDATPLHLRHVLFVSGLGPEDKHSFRRFLDFAKTWKAEQVHLLAVNTGGFFGQPTYLMAQLLADFASLSVDLPVKTHFINDLSIDAGVKKFSKEQGIGLIGISNHTRHPVKRLIRGSNVETVVNHSVVPVLSIDY